jgi:predicted transcriptional regulator of viral defense system
MDEVKRVKDSELPLGGLGAISRSRLAKVLRASSGTITPADAARALGEDRTVAAKQLSRWASQGWLQRVRRGIYVAVPIESERPDSVPEDPWIIAETAYAPCFIAGWSAAEHWDMTEQVFRSVCVSTARKLRMREQVIGGTTFVLRTVSQAQFFGLKTIWRGRTRVQVTDPSRTIVDLLADPKLGGGLRSTVDMLSSYLKTKDLSDLPRLVAYAEKLGNRAVFKRLGFLLQRLAPEETDAIADCAQRLSSGYAKLDPSLPPERLVTAWGLWIPAGW